MIALIASPMTHATTCGVGNHITGGIRLFVYCLHQHVLYNKCGATFATIDPESLATLPTEVFEQFPFMSPSKSGPGIYTPMVLMLVSLLPHSVMLGTFANSINTLQRTNYLCTVTCVIFGQGSMLVQRA